MLRPKKTAEIILKYHPAAARIAGWITEISHGLWEGKLEAEIEQAYPGELHRWRTQPLRYKCRQGKICSRCGSSRLAYHLVISS